MNLPTSSYFLPLLGIGIVVFCILSFFFPYGEKFKGKIQKIKGFGVDLEVSVLTLFIIIGVILSFSGVYLQIKDYEEQLYQVKKERDTVKERLEEATRMEIKILVTLDGVSENNMPKLEDLQCNYLLYGEEEPVRVDVNKGYTSNQFKITLKELPCKAHIARLVVEDLSTGGKWAKKTFLPFEPNYHLEKD